MKAEYTDPGMLRFFSERPPKAAFSFAAIPVSCIRTAAQALKRKRKTVKEQTVRRKQYELCNTDGSREKRFSHGTDDSGGGKGAYFREGAVQAYGGGQDYHPLQQRA